MVTTRDEYRMSQTSIGTNARNWGEKFGLVFDNSSVHKSLSTTLSGKLSFKFLPAYSPELNPVERFFEELRRRIANRVFGSLSDLESVLLEIIDEYCNDREKVRQLCGYPWILEQIQRDKDT